MPKLTIKKNNILGIEVIHLLQQGHAVRRSCWVKDFYIRITNETGFDDAGNCIFDEKDAIYTHATNGCFMHIGNSSQPYNFKHRTREGEGLGMLFQNDWEDYGFISSESFDNLTEEIKHDIRREVHKYIIETY